ncbi:hypothetical protein D3C87_1251700 [compost metagenome]|jgi:hypothetical protein
MNQTIDTATARRMAEAGAIRGVAIIGQPTGWSVMLKVGMTEKPLGGQRTDKPRTWRSLDTLTEYLREDLHIVRVDGIDATHYGAGDVAKRSRPDAAARMKRAHEAAAHDEWFKGEVEQAIKEADDPATQWISHETVMTKLTKRRAKYAKAIKEGAA